MPEFKMPLMAKGTVTPPYVDRKMAEDEKYAELRNSFDRQAKATENIAESSKIQADIAVAKSKKADVKGMIAIIISLATLAIEFIINYETIVEFFKSFT